MVSAPGHHEISLCSEQLKTHPTPTILLGCFPSKEPPPLFCYFFPAYFIPWDLISAVSSSLPEANTAWEFKATSHSDRLGVPAAVQVSLNMDLQEVFQPVLKLEYLQIHSLSIQSLDSAGTAARCDNTFGLQHLLPYGDQGGSESFQSLSQGTCAKRQVSSLCQSTESPGLEKSIENLCDLSKTCSDSQLPSFCSC